MPPGWTQPPPPKKKKKQPWGKGCKLCPGTIIGFYGMGGRISLRWGSFDQKSEVKVPF